MLARHVSEFAAGYERPSPSPARDEFHFHSNESEFSLHLLCLPYSCMKEPFIELWAIWEVHDTMNKKLMPKCHHAGCKGTNLLLWIIKIMGELLVSC